MIPPVDVVTATSHDQATSVARSSPLLRISSDGNTWTELDLSEQLGCDAARWDGHLDAIAIDDEIHITSTIGELRIVLIGNVNAASASS